MSIYKLWCPTHWIIFFKRAPFIYPMCSVTSLAIFKGSWQQHFLTKIAWKLGDFLAALKNISLVITTLAIFGATCWKKFVLIFIPTSGPTAAMCAFELRAPARAQFGRSASCFRARCRFPDWDASKFKIQSVFLARATTSHQQERFAV